jgi:putative spermidine/putrescine transport system ATP-binding protein
MAQVTLRGLTKRFGQAAAVDRISLDIAHGEFVSLLGPSGCGKTTTLKLIAGFEAADEGAILFDGDDVVAVPAERRDIGMVFQSYALFPHLTVGGNVGFGLEMRNRPKAEIARRIADALSIVQLDGLAGRYPRELSGGQQQRVALARALVIEPRILLLDEPLANLDARLREDMRDFIRTLQRRVGITTIYVTHDQAEALTMSDKIVVMFGGHIAQVGDAEAIYERPASRAVADFVGRVNIVTGTVIAGDMVRTGLGDLPTDGTDAVATGAQVALVLRPEAIRLVAGDTARVVSATYSGGLVDYQIETNSGLVLHAQNYPSPRFAVGAAVGLAYAQARLWRLGG